MADEAVVKEDKKAPAETAGTAAPTGRKPKKKKSRPTNCVQSNKRIRRKDWYYRNGKYFANKKAFKLYVTQEAEKALKAKEAQEAAAAAAEKAPAAEPPPASA